MEGVMDGSGWRELKLIRHWGDLLSDGEGPMTFWGEFVRLIGQGQIAPL